MRREFIECETLEEAYSAAPWAATIIEVDGGWMAFESVDDYDVWKKQD